MKIQQQGETLDVTGISALNASNSQAFKAALCGSFPEQVKSINVDLSQASHLDCRGVGALVALRNCASRADRKIAVRVLNPSRPVQHMLRLTNLDRVFPIHCR